MMKNTVRLHRILAAKPEKVYRAFIEPDAMAKWLPPNGFTAKFVNTIGRDEEAIRGSIRNQEKEDQRFEQLNLWR